MSSNEVDRLHAYVYFFNQQRDAAVNGVSQIKDIFTVSIINEIAMS